eukprot:221406-Chlamydomonas_euryale.AAC.1
MQAGAVPCKLVLCHASRCRAMQAGAVPCKPLPCREAESVGPALRSTTCALSPIGTWARGDCACAVTCREAELSGLRSEVHEALGNRNVADDQFKNATLDDLHSLRAALQLEREERIAEDDEIVQ